LWNKEDHRAPQSSVVFYAQRILGDIGLCRAKEPVRKGDKEGEK